MALLLRCLLAMASLLAGPVASPAAWAQAPQRVVTVNLCLDQIALRLAAPGPLVGVSYLSHDPRISVLAERARAIPAVRAKVESILELRPDLVIFDRDAHANIKRLVRKAGVPILEVPWASSLETAETLITRIGTALGRDAEAQAIVAGIEKERLVITADVQTAALARASGLLGPYVRRTMDRQVRKVRRDRA